MYTGKRERPCCLCGNPETVRRLDLPPRAIEALTNDVRERQDHRAREREALAAAEETIAAFDAGDNPGEQALVEARVVQWTLADLRADAEPGA